MKFGCRNDPYSAYLEPHLIYFDESSYYTSNSSYCSYGSDLELCNNRFDLTLSLTSNNTSTSGELSFVDVAVRNIMNEISTYEDDIARVDLMRFVVNSLYKQLSILKDQIAFLRADSNSKTNTIGCLLNELSKSRKNNIFNYPGTSDSSLRLQVLMNNQNSSYETCDSPASKNQETIIDDLVLHE